MDLYELCEKEILSQYSEVKKRLPKRNHVEHSAQKSGSIPALDKLF